MKHSLACAGFCLVLGAAFVANGCGSEDLDNEGGLVGGAGTGGGAGSGGTAGASGCGGVSGGTGGAATGGKGGTGGGVANSPLGSNCVTDVDCGEGLTCLKSFGTSTDELAGGLCTLACDPALLDVDCDAAEPGSLCVGFTETESYCMEGCMLGADAGCSDRTNVFCIDLSAEGSTVPAPVCLPFCVNDDQCTMGVCDHETGLCAAMSDPGTLLLGAACTPVPAGTVDPPPDTCAEGFCVSIVEDDSQGVCSQICRGDVVPQCGWAGPGVPLTAICLQPAESGLLDLGLCRKGCNCDMDCGNPDFVCFAEPQLAQFEAAGYCVLSTDAMGMPVVGIPTCPPAP
jgi:hypothetical protein